MTREEQIQKDLEMVRHNGMALRYVEEQDLSELNRIIETDCEQIAALVNARFEKCRENIKAKILSRIKEMLTPIPPHYVWRHDGCPYDSSGVLDKDGYVSLDQTVSEFLENEYAGYNEATYISGCGLHWCSWGDDLSYETLDIGFQIMQQVISEYLSEKLGRTVTDDEMSFANTDPVYDLCYAMDFFSYEPAIKFIGIGDIFLSTLLKEPVIEGKCLETKVKSAKEVLEAKEINGRQAQLAEDKERVTDKLEK